MSRELEETSNPTVTTYYPKVWTSDMYYTDIIMPAGKYDLRELKLDLGINAAVNLVWTMRRSEDDLCNYQFDSYARTDRDQPYVMGPTPLSHYCHKLIDLGVTIFEFPAPWMVNVHTINPLSTKPSISYTTPVATPAVPEEQSPSTL